MSSMNSYPIMCDIKECDIKEVSVCTQVGLSNILATDLYLARDVSYWLSLMLMVEEGKPP